MWLFCLETGIQLNVNFPLKESKHMESVAKSFDSSAFIDDKYLPVLSLT